MSRERIQKVLANAGVASRRACEELVLTGRVQVNGKVVRALPILVDLQEDDVRVDGERIKPARPIGVGRHEPRHVYILLNKPANVVCTNRPQQTAGRVQRTALDLLPPDFRRRVYPVGRLDAASRGLLLLTDDGELTHKLTHPKFGVPKTYRVACDGEVTPDVIEELKKGVFLVDRDTGQGSKTGPARLKIVRRSREGSTLEMTIKEGRNRQVRRMLAALGHKVRDLKRTRIGPLKLEQLPESASRLLRPRELAELRNAVERATGPGEHKGAKRQRA
jgi:pseudouridine synthase